MSKQNPFDEGSTDSGTAGSEAAAVETDTSATTESTTPAPEPDQTPSRPAKSASKPEWVAYAEYLGLSSEGTTAEIQARVNDAEDADPNAAEPSPEEPLSKLDGSHLPISAQHGEIQGSVSINPAGVAVLTLSVFGMIGDTGLVILSGNAGDFDDVLNDLREQAKALTADAE